MKEVLDKQKIISKSDFGTSFKWGVSVAAYQIEGAHDQDDKGQSIWDVFTSKKKNIHSGHHGQVACDFYNRYKDDVGLLKYLNIPNFRFSLSWSRIIPNGIGRSSYKGICFYNKLIDKCLEAGVEPWVTLYHWDLPHALEEKGGWTNREVVDWFSEYVELCVKNFGDRVKHWMVMNEPMVFTGAGYFLGKHAPGKRGLSNFLPALHHATLSIAEGGRIIRQLQPDAEVGTTFSCSYIEPYRQTEKDIRTAVKIDALLNRLFIEPIVGRGYPLQDLPILRRVEKYIRGEDEKRMQFDFDFIGIQNYTREIVKYNFWTPYLQARIIPPAERNIPSTLMNWEVYPEAIYQMIKKFNGYSEIKRLMITENGAAFTDHLIDGRIHDEERRSYIEEHLKQVLRAKQEGLNVEGYFVWTFTDNFEWAEGYHPRFGLVYVDFDTQKRIIKDSGYWYREFLSED
jgi:beta-glucosidase